VFDSFYSRHAVVGPRHKKLKSLLVPTLISLLDNRVRLSVEQYVCEAGHLQVEKGAM